MVQRLWLWSNALERCLHQNSYIFFTPNNMINFFAHPFSLHGALLLYQYNTYCIQCKKLSYRRDSTRRRSLRRSRSFKVINFDTNRKTVCDFILATNTNSPPISHLFSVLATLSLSTEGASI